MTLALYRKYRPQTFRELVGENHIKITLENEIKEEKFAHAYLFFGPRGIGKTTVARLLAKAANCENRKKGESEPCNQCEACREITALRSLDIIEIDAASHTGVDNVRENIINNVRFTPTRRKFKVFIIDEVQMLSLSAFNALLKTLEEPPAHVIFILATTEIHKIPPTIISRCQRFDFKKVNREDLVARLNFIAGEEKRELEKEVLENIVRLSGGSVRDAESLLGQVLALATKKVTKEEAELILPRSDFHLVKELTNHLIKKNVAESLILLNRLVEERLDLIRFTEDLLEFLRKMLLIKIGGSLREYSLEFEEEIEKELEKMAKSSKIEEIIFMLNLFLEKKIDLKNASIPQLPLELAVIEICSLKPEDNFFSKKTSEEKIDEEKNFSSVKNKKDDKPREKLQSLSNRLVEAVISPTTQTLRESFSAVKEKITKGEKKEAREINLSEIQEKWSEILKKAEAYNHSLVFILKMAVPKAIKANILELNFKYKLHEDKIKEKKNLEIFENILKEIFKTKIGITTKIDPSIDNFVSLRQSASLKEKFEERGEKESGDNLVADVLRVFGGRIIE